MLPPQRAAEVMGYYLQGQAAENPYASPVFGRYENPPPALIMASTAEILTDDATRLAEALRRGGGDVRLEIWPRLPHAWPLLLGYLRAAPQAIAAAGRFIEQRMAGKS